MAKQQSITSLPRSPSDDRRSRTIKYVVAMSVRLVCIVLCLVVHGWWILVFGLGAVLLPYVAVVLANSVTRPNGAVVVRPGAIVPMAPRSDARPGEPRTHPEDDA
jgi:hypothetical protein